VNRNSAHTLIVAVIRIRRRLGHKDRHP
jgi:hypothetical protein